jgi:hypothetical protein
VKEGRDRFREMMWCCWCPRSGWRGPVLAGRREAERRRSSELTGAVEGGATMREIKIGWAEEYQWVTVMLW